MGSERRCGARAAQFLRTVAWRPGLSQDKEVEESVCRSAAGGWCAANHTACCQLFQCGCSSKESCTHIYFTLGVPVSQCDVRSRCDAILSTVQSQPVKACFHAQVVLKSTKPPHDREQSIHVHRSTICATGAWYLCSSSGGSMLCRTCTVKSSSCIARRSGRHRYADSSRARLQSSMW